MSLVKNISGGPLDVPLLDRTVEADETVEVPDYQPGHSPADRPPPPKDPDEEPIPFEEMPIIWPPDKWEPADVPAVKPERAAKSAKDTSGKADG